MKRHRPVIRLSSPGDFVVGAFCGEPRGLDVHWFGERFRICKLVGCPYCNRRKALVVPHNFYLYGEDKVEIVELSEKFGGISEVKCRYPFGDWWFKIERASCKSYSVEPHGRLTKQDRAMIRRAQLHDLADLYPESYDAKEDRPRRRERRRESDFR
jgi:hypothetical protein